MYARWYARIYVANLILYDVHVYSVYSVWAFSFSFYFLFWRETSKGNAKISYNKNCSIVFIKPN